MYSINYHVNARYPIRIVAPMIFSIVYKFKNKLSQKFETKVKKWEQYQFMSSSSLFQ